MQTAGDVSDFEGYFADTNTLLRWFLAHPEEAAIYRRITMLERLSHSYTDMPVELDLLFMGAIDSPEDLAALRSEVDQIWNRTDAGRRWKEMFLQSLP